MEKNVKIISFIIPSYNVERYLNKALDSFLTLDLQTNEKVEVLIVDDGSEDRTAEIAHSYVERDPIMYKLLKKENGGHGSTINLGSREATGKFFKVIDADDWVITENLLEYIQYLETSDADVVLTPFHTVDMVTGKRTMQKMYISDYSRCYTPDEVAADWKSFDKCATFHGIAYRTEFYNQMRNELPENVFYEDQEYATIPFCHARKIAVLELPIYQYLIGNSEQSVSTANKLKRISHQERVIRDMLYYWKAQEYNAEFVRSYFIKKMEDILLAYYKVMCIINPDKSSGRKSCSRLNREIRESSSEIYKNLSRKYALFYIFSLLRINEKVYEKIIHSYLFRLVRHNRKIEKEE